jgi:tetratricopeptide (TPR) repeat protein
MTDDRWFRNEHWDAQVSSAFEEKLRRARRKSQYLRIQACYLSQTHPRVALDLLDRYFALGDDFDHAQAQVDRAEAYLALGRIEDAFTSYEAALKREEEFPNLRTGAYLKLPYQIALWGSAHRYDQAMALLSNAGSRLMFAVDHFVFHATKAIILSAQGNLADARAEARPALEAASRDHSGFRYHPGVGLVSDKHAKALSLLRSLCDA